MEWTIFCQKTEILLKPIKSKINYSFDDNNINYEIANEKYQYSKKEFQKIIEEFKDFKINNFSINNGNNFEYIVNFFDSRSRSEYIYYGDKFEKTLFDSVNQIDYQLSKPSNKIILIILKNYTSTPSRIISPLFFEHKFRESDEKDIFSLIKIMIPTFYTVKINIKDKINDNEAIKYLNSFLFTLSFNMGLVLRSVKEISDIIPQRPSLRIKKRCRFEEIMAPNRVYEEALLEHYSMALGSLDTFTKYISYYHIMEHFYDDVYMDDLVMNVENVLTNPGFSYKKKKEIIRLITTIKKKTKSNNDEFIGTEFEALELTIKKYVELSELCEEIKDFDDNLIEYYKNHEISFSKGDAIDLEDYDNEKLVKKIAGRIYKTRNSLVHSKSNNSRDSDRGVYNPFTNKEELNNEIILMKLIAEKIIIKSSTLI